MISGHGGQVWLCRLQFWGLTQVEEEDPGGQLPHLSRGLASFTMEDRALCELSIELRVGADS